uniref:CA domain-containing protein n=1 Tax=Caenorhabditis tropicalis TaxID=1561998 RepID=A0A1I7U981_9PELO
MIALTNSLALCTVFIFLSISILIFIAVFYICKYHYEQIQLEKCAIYMKPEEVDKNNGKRMNRCEKGEFEADVEMELPYYSSTNVPQIILSSDELPPEYHELESARASPLPSYDDVVYCDQLNRSFQNLLSAR